MCKRATIEVLDHLLDDLMDSKDIFGGKVVVLGGDFRQNFHLFKKEQKIK